MANPQLEEGYLRIAITILEAMMRTNFSAYQSRIIKAIWRKTWAWNKKFERITLRQYNEMTGIPKPHICRTLAELRERKIVTYSGNKIGFNKDYSQWRALPIQVTRKNVTNSGNEITSMGNVLLPIQATPPLIDTKTTLLKEKNVTHSGNNLKAEAIKCYQKCGGGCGPYRTTGDFSKPMCVICYEMNK